MKLKLLLLFLSISLFCSHNSQASGLAGASIEWLQLDSNNYRVYFNIYISCDTSAVGTPRIAYTSSCNTIKSTSSKTYPAVDVSDFCPSQCTQCSTPSCKFPYGIKKLVRIEEVNVSKIRQAGCCFLNVGAELSGRDGAITTGHSNQNLYISAEINLCAGLNNHSIKFRKEPPALLSLGKDFMFDAGGVNRNNGQVDSVHYYLDTAIMTSSGISNSYKSPYQPEKFLSYLGFPNNYSSARYPFGLHLDSIDGTLIFRPMKIEASVGVIRAKMYNSSGQYLGSTMRDMIFRVIKLSNNNPPKSGSASAYKGDTYQDTFKVCLGQKVIIKLETTDKDKDDTVSILNYKHNIPNAKTTLNRGYRDNLEIEWAPTSLNPYGKPYEVFLSYADNACPINAKGFKTSYFYVTDSVRPKISFTQKHPKPFCGEYAISASEINGQVFDKMNLYLDTVLVKSQGLSDTISSNFTLLKNRDYSVKLEVNTGNCWHTYYDTLHVSKMKQMNVTFKDSLDCRNQVIFSSFEISGGYGHKATNWKYDSDSTLSDSIQYPYQNIAWHQADSFNSTLTITDSAGCTFDTTHVVNGKYSKQLPNHSYFGDTICTNQSQAINLDSYLDTNNTSIEWMGDGVINDIFYTVLVKPGRHEFKYLLEEKTHCYYTSGYIITGPPHLDTILKSARHCASDSFLKLNNNKGNWKSKNVPLIYDQGQLFAKLNELDAGLYHIHYSSYSQYGCPFKDSLELTVLDTAAIKIQTDTNFCFEKADTFWFDKTHPNFNWTGPNLVLENGQTGFRYSNGFNQPKRFKYAQRNQLGCWSRPSFQLKIYPDKHSGITALDTFCITTDQKAYHLDNPINHGIWTGNSVKGNNGSFRIDVSQLTPPSENFFYSFSDENKCNRADTFTLNFNKTPLVKLRFDSSKGLNAPAQITFFDLSNNPKGSRFWTLPNAQTRTDSTFTSTFENQGAYQIKLEILDQYKICSNIDSTILKINRNLASTYPNANGFSVYPNPAHNSITIFTTNQNKIEILDINGRLVLKINPSSETTYLNIENLDAGTYLISNTQGRIEKLIVTE